MPIQLVIVDSRGARKEQSGFLARRLTPSPNSFRNLFVIKTTN
jgi:hypothetical protein